MASFEKVVALTRRFDVVDAEDNEDTVLEYTTYLVRRSDIKIYRPMLGGFSYRLENGITVRRAPDGHFESEDGSKRFIVICTHDVLSTDPDNKSGSTGVIH